MDRSEAWILGGLPRRGQRRHPRYGRGENSLSNWRTEQVLGSNDEMPVWLWGDDQSTDVEEFAPLLASKCIKRQAYPNSVGSPYHWMSKPFLT